MPAFSPKNILVTGGAGFIGSNFVRRLLSSNSGVHIVNLDKLTYAGSRENLDGLPSDGTHRFVQGDINDRKLLQDIFSSEQIDTVVHFAAESHVDRSIASPSDFIETNITGTYALLETARAAWPSDGGDDRRFVHVSTDEVYGSLNADDPAFSETTAYAPNSPYSASKAAADHLARAWFHTFDLPVVTTNCSNNYGPFQHDEKLIPTVIRSCVLGENIPVYGDGSNIRDWIFVGDHCDGILAVLRKGEAGETYNLGGDNEVANIDLVREICAVMDEVRPQSVPHADLIEFVTDRPGHDWRYAIDSTKALANLDWKPTKDLRVGLRETVEWYLRHRFPD